MLNQVILVGRLVDDPKVKELEDGRKVSTITLAVSRSYKNADGLYDTDFIRCVLWDGIASNTREYCKKGDIVGIKGRLQQNSYENSKGEKRNEMNVITEKVTFLSHSNDNVPEKSDNIEEEVEK